MQKNNRRYLHQLQNSQRNSDLNLFQKQPKYQHALAYKCLKHFNYRQQLLTAIAVILVNIIVRHNYVDATSIAVAENATVTVTVADSYVRSNSSIPFVEIGRDNSKEIVNNQKNISVELKDGYYLNINTGSSSSEAQPHQQQPQQQQQRQHHRNGLHTKFSALDKEVVDRLIKEWAPIVWLAPEEKFMPLGVDEFLNHVHPMDKGKTFIPGMPIGDDSKKAYLVTNSEIEELLGNEKSFIYGRNPSESPVPIYAVVKLCNEPIRKHFAPNPPVKISSVNSQFMPPANAANFISASNGEAAASSFQNSIPLSLALPIVISSTRGPYIPISIDRVELHNDTTGRRSARLFPAFKRLRRSILHTIDIEQNASPLSNSLPSHPLTSQILLNLPPKGLVIEPYDDLMLGETPTIDFDKLKHVPEQNTDTTPSVEADDNSGQVNNFIANLADNVKFSMPTDEFREDDNNIVIDTNFGGLQKNRTGDKAGKKAEESNANKYLNVPSFHVTYWMFYPYSQGKTMCTLSLGPFGNIPFPAVYGFCLGRHKDIGSHIGDWEHMSLYFTGDAEPEAMYVSAHDAGAYYSYNRLTGSFEFKKQETRKGILQRPNFPKTVTTFNNHPVLFAAKGSHGLWTAPGKHRFVKVARLYDINGFGTPWNTWKSVDITYENLKSYGRALVPSWLSFKGKWGNPKSKCHPFRRIGLNFCEYTDGPTGIPLKEPHFQCNTA